MKNRQSLSAQQIRVLLQIGIIPVIVTIVGIPMMFSSSSSWENEKADIPVIVPKIVIEPKPEPKPEVKPEEIETQDILPISYIPKYQLTLPDTVEKNSAAYNCFKASGNTSEECFKLNHYAVDEQGTKNPDSRGSGRRNEFKSEHSPDSWEYWEDWDNYKKEQAKKSQSFVKRALSIGW